MVNGGIGRKQVLSDGSRDDGRGVVGERIWSEGMKRRRHRERCRE